MLQNCNLLYLSLGDRGGGGRGGRWGRNIQKPTGLKPAILHLKELTSVFNKLFKRSQPQDGSDPLTFALSDTTSLGAAEMTGPRPFH